MKNRIEKVKEIRKLLGNKKIDKIVALEQLSKLINEEKNKVSEKEVYLQELDRLKKVELIRNKILKRISDLEDDNEQIIELLNLNESEFQKLQHFCYKLL